MNEVTANQINTDTPKSISTILKEVWAFLKSLVWILFLAYCIRETVIQPYKIPTGSMIPTLLISDHLLVSKLSYGLRLPYIPYFKFFEKIQYQWAMPKRGEVVVFTRPDDPASPEDDSDINLIKRVIGLPGEVVEVKGTQVYINGKALNEPYTRYSEGGLWEGNFGPATVPAGRIFLMGDNRDNSKDSRFWTDHFLEADRLIGRALFIHWSWDSLSRIGTIIR